MRGPIAVATLLLSLVGCRKDATATPEDPAASSPEAVRMPPSREPVLGAPVGVGSLRAPIVGAPYAIVVPANADAGAIRDALEAAAKARGYVVDPEQGKTADLVASAEIGTVADANVRVEAIEYFGRGLAEADVSGLRSAAQAVLFAAVGPPDALVRVQHDAAAIVTEVATEGWIVDSATAEVFSRAAFAEARPDGFTMDVRRLIVVHMVREGDGPLVFLETLGLERLGVPELYIGGVPPGFADELLVLVNAAAQTLLERGSVTADGELAVDLAALESPAWAETTAVVVDNGGSGKVTFQAKWSRGDGGHMLVELALPSGRDSERMYAAIGAFLGHMQQAPAMAPEGDAELLAASARARKALAKLVDRCVKGLPELESLTIKAPFEIGDGVEFMWVEVHACRGDRFQGVLLNEPLGPSDLRPGSTVEVALEDVFDYVHRRADGSTEGGETNEILLRRGGGG